MLFSDSGSGETQAAGWRNFKNYTGYEGLLYVHLTISQSDRGNHAWGAISCKNASNQNLIYAGNQGMLNGSNVPDIFACVLYRFNSTDTISLWRYTLDNVTQISWSIKIIKVI